MMTEDMISGEVSSEIEKQVEKQIEKQINDWSTDEIIELLAECEMLLSYNEGRLKQLDIKGLKRLWNMISGIETKNRQAVLKNMQEMQKISLNIQKILLKRISLVDDMLFSLNRKENLHTLQTRYMIYQMLRKFERMQSEVKDIEIKQDLMGWYWGIKQNETESGELYLDKPEGMKVLLVVSDLFRIVRGHKELIKKAELKTALHDLGLEETLNISDLYGAAIREKECLPLYIKDYFDYQTEGISPQGKMLHKISEFYANPLLDEVAEVIKEPAEELCWKIIEKDICETDGDISSYDLCMSLLEDMQNLNLKFQETMRSQMQSNENFLNEEPGKERIEERDYSILRISPGALCILKDGTYINEHLDCKERYIFRDAPMVWSYIKTVDPQMIVAPMGFWDKGESEIKNEFSAKYVSLSDYYMYLWFRYNKDAEKRANKNLAFIEYYGSTIYVSPYIVDQTGNSYEKKSVKKIDHGRSITSMVSDIRGLEAFKGQEKNSILMFQLFKSDLQGLYKLEKYHGVKRVSGWDGILKEDTEMRKEVVTQLLKKSGM